MDESLLKQYQKQWQWRYWNSLYDQLPSFLNSTVYDLGCAHGDHSAQLTSRGATVIGLDGNEELLGFAKKRKIPGAQFIQCDLTSIDQMNLTPADGVWMSFVAAYFTDFESMLTKIKKLIKPGGWLAITEMSGLLDHEPMPTEYRVSIEEFYEEMQSSRSYDFNSGSKLEKALANCRLKTNSHSFLRDDELSKQGPCSEDVITAWSHRFERMGGFKEFLGEDFPAYKNDFLSCLKSPEHRSNCQVHFFLATN
jgi:SAM-dependent methyltransferase